MTDGQIDKKTRREFLQSAAVIGAGIAAGGILPADSAELVNDHSQTNIINSSSPDAIAVSLKINGKTENLKVDPRASLLDVFREQLGLTGTKKGCDHGQCGACTVLVDGQRINSCLTFAVMYQGKDLKTIEGIANGDQLHPLQQAFIERDGFQCGYCTPGQICSAIGMIEECKSGHASFVSDDITAAIPLATLSREEIKERMSGNLCRCGAHPGIVEAIKDVAGRLS